MLTDCFRMRGLILAAFHPSHKGIISTYPSLLLHTSSISIARSFRSAYDTHFSTTLLQRNTSIWLYEPNNKNGSFPAFKHLYGPNFCKVLHILINKIKKSHSKVSWQCWASIKQRIIIILNSTTTITVDPWLWLQYYRKLMLHKF